MGYLKNQTATQKAFEGGWFHTGDVAVVHADGYLQITDRCHADPAQLIPTH
jgi:fatty-acyl-CoA synthase